MHKVAIACLVACGCGAVEPSDPLDQPLGEPTADRPSYPERLALWKCNEARMDPAATGWPAYPKVPPLLWHDELAQAARAHSTDMRDTPCFQHNSCDGTDPFVRIQMYWKGPFSSMGENIMAGINDGQTAISNWIDEIGAAPGETGHRDNMFSGTFHYVGFGYEAGGTQFQGYWTQDFAGVTPAPTVPRLPSGIHFPQSNAAGSSINFATVYYDAGGAAPDRVELVLDGKATPLMLSKGTASAGSYVGIAKVAAGCHRYYFRAVVGGKGAVYPDSGTLGVASADALASCPDFMAGGVDPNPVSGGGGGGGCAVAPGRASPTGALALLALSALATALARARRRR